MQESVRYDCRKWQWSSSSMPASILALFTNEFCLAHVQDELTSNRSSHASKTPAVVSIHMLPDGFAGGVDTSQGSDNLHLPPPPDWNYVWPFHAGGQRHHPAKLCAPHCYN